MTNANLSPPQVDDFFKNGYLVLKDFAPADGCERLKAHANELLDSFDPKSVAPWCGPNAPAHMAAAYFLTSGDKIRFIFDSEAFKAGGDTALNKFCAVSKIGHALHDLDPMFNDFIRTPEHQAIAHDLGMAQPRIVQSMYVFTPPSATGGLACHQDSAYLYTKPQSALGFWFVLDDVTVENGCLWVMAEAHTAGLKQRVVRTRHHHLQLKTLEDAPFPTTQLTPIEATKGTLVLLHGQLPYRFGPTQTGSPGHAYVAHAVDGKAQYSSHNWLQRPSNHPARGF